MHTSPHRPGGSPWQNAFTFESSSDGRLPVFSLFQGGAARRPACFRFRGIFNSTTNLILSRMETGESFEQAVAYAQAIGIAETDPSGDIDGWDAAIKVAALATVLMDIPLKPAAGRTRTASAHIGPAEIDRARHKASAGSWSAQQNAADGASSARVWHPSWLAAAFAHVYHVEGTTSIVQFETDVLGQLTILEENPGPPTTAYGCLADFLNAVSV